jgi:hypothetical protein
VDSSCARLVTGTQGAYPARDDTRVRVRSRVIRVLPGTYPGSNNGLPYLTDAGVSVFRDGALASLIGAVLMTVTGLASVYPGSAQTVDRRARRTGAIPT